MKSSSLFRPTIVLNALLALILARLTLAYLEPSPSSFLLKILISGLAGLVLAYRFIWRTIRLLFSKFVSGKKKKAAD
jgi:hypothetical protein